MNWRGVRDGLMTGLIGGLLLVLIIVGLELAVAIPQWQRHSNELMEEIHAQSISALYTQAAVRKSLDGMQREVAGARSDLIARLELALTVAKIELDQANQTLYRTGYSLSRASASIAESVDRPAAGAAQIESQVSDAIALSFDCDHNADCFHNRWVGVARASEHAAGSVEEMSKAWGDAAPAQSAAATGALQQTEKTMGHAEAITGELAKKPPLWLKILKYASWLKPW